MDIIKPITKKTEQWFYITPTNMLYDRTLLFLYLGMLVFGCIMVTSASMYEQKKFVYDVFYYAKRDLLYIIVAFLFFLIFIQMPIDKWEKHHKHLLLLGFILLSMVLVFGISVNGAKRWFRIGSINFQPAEYVKLVMIIYLSGFFLRKEDEILHTNTAKGFFKPLIILGILGILLLLQPDLGSCVVLSVITFGLLFIAGGRLLHFVWLCSVVALLAFYAIILSAYRTKRATTFLDPFSDPLGAGYQLTHSLMSYGRGGIFGVGLGNSVEKFYLPEAHTDFIMAIVGEELGLIGLLFVIFLLSFLLYKSFKISNESLQLDNKFNRYLSIGIAFWLFFQGCSNIAMTLSMIPTKGFTFPIISYGGSSQIITSIAVAILMRIDFENRLKRNKVFVRDD